MLSRWLLQQSGRCDLKESARRKARLTTAQDNRRSDGRFIIMFGRDFRRKRKRVSECGGKFCFRKSARSASSAAAYNNSVGAHDMTSGRKSLADVLINSKALLIGGSLSKPPALTDGFLRNKIFVVQECLKPRRPNLPMSFCPPLLCEVDGTYTTIRLCPESSQAIQPAIKQSRLDDNFDDCKRNGR